MMTAVKSDNWFNDSEFILKGMEATQAIGGIDYLKVSYYKYVYVSMKTIQWSIILIN